MLRSVSCVWDLSILVIAHVARMDDVVGLDWATAGAIDGREDARLALVLAQERRLVERAG